MARIPLKKLRKKLNTTEITDKFVNMLLARSKHNMPISNNPMIDGFIISTIVYQKVIFNGIIFDHDIGKLTDSNLQKYENIVKWLYQYEDELLTAFEEYLKGNMWSFIFE